MRQRPIIQGMQQPIWHFGTLYVVSGYVICREHSSFLRVLEVFWLTMACSPEHPVKILTMNLCFEIFEYIVRSERYFLPDTNIYIPTTWLWPHVCLSPLSEFQSRTGEEYSIQHYVINLSVTWFSPSTLISSTNYTDRHDIVAILLKVALNTITQPSNQYLSPPMFIVWHNFSTT